MTTNTLPNTHIGTPAHEWAEHTTGLLARPSGAESDTDHTSDYPAQTKVTTPGPHLPGAYLDDSSSTVTAVKDSVDSALDSAKQYIPAQADVQNALSAAAQSVKGYLPKGVVDYMSASPTTTSLPSTETTGTIPYEHVSGVGALPGRISEAGVASLPHERVVDEARALGRDTKGVGSADNASKGAGAWRETEDKGRVANEDADPDKHAQDTWRHSEDKGLALGGVAAVAGETESEKNKEGKKEGKWRESEDKGRLEGAGAETSPSAAEKEKTINRKTDFGGLGAGVGGAGVAAVAEKEKKSNNDWRKSEEKGQLGGAGVGTLGSNKHENDRDDAWRQSEDGNKSTRGTTDVGTAGRTGMTDDAWRRSEDGNKTTSGTTDVGTAGKTSTTDDAWRRSEDGSKTTHGTTGVGTAGKTGTTATAQAIGTGSTGTSQDKSTSERGRETRKGVGQVRTDARTHALGGEGVTWGGAEIGPHAEEGKRTEGEDGGKQGKDTTAGKDGTERKSVEGKVREKVQGIQKQTQGGQDKKETQKVDTQKPTSKQESDRDDKHHPSVLHPDTKAQETGSRASGETDSSFDKPSQSPSSSAHGEKKKVRLVDKMRGEAKVVAGKLGHREEMVEEGRRLVRGE